MVRQSIVRLRASQRFEVRHGDDFMLVFYLTVDGRAVKEKVKLKQRMIEMPDGNHPITNDSVWQDARRRRPPVMIIVQGVRGPYGATMENEDVSSILYEIECDERAFRPPSVSKMLWRQLTAVGSWLMKSGFYVAIMLLVVYLLWSSVLGGGNSG